MASRRDRITAGSAVQVDLGPDDRLIVDVLRHALEGIVAMYRFGSSVDGTTHRESDTDVAVLARTRLRHTDRFDLQERLAAGLGRDVDLVDLAATTPMLAIQVVARGCLRFDGDADARGRFEDRTFSAYARLNDERRGILERVRSEGTVYGR
jgi:predicted nucleotidyltransferase